MFRRFLALIAFVAGIASPAAAAAPGGPPGHSPGDDVVRARLIVLGGAAPAGAIAEAAVELTPASGWHLYGPEHGDAGRPPEIAWSLPRGVTAGRISWPPSTRVRTHGLTTYEYAGRTTLRIPLAIAADAQPRDGTAIRADVNWVVCSHVCVPGRATLTSRLNIAPAGGTGAGAIAFSLALAFIGGLLLNLMPCVFPVLSFKALRAIGEPSDRRLRSAIAYTAGVTTSSLTLGIILLVARAAGHAIGWGFQLQSPVFVAFLALTFLALGLAMSGVYEITLPIPARLQHRAATAGSFGDGVLVSVIASACIAPYMGAALGFALTASAPAAVGIFVALGLGLALPHAVITLTPKLLGRLPKPGPWMLVVRRVLALPLYASAVWLAWVFVQQVAPSPQVALTSPGHIATTFSTANLAALRHEHRAVLVDVSAAWCITCKVNERFALDRPEVSRRLGDLHVSVLHGDWTNQNPQITAYLRSFGTAGVPLYVYYAANGRVNVWPQLLTPSVVLDRLAQS